VDNKDVRTLIIRVFGTDEGKLLLAHLYNKNVDTCIATTNDLLEIGKRQGKADFIRQINDIIKEVK
jgi:hypothetical protein